MSDPLFRRDPYARTGETEVIGISPEGWPVLADSLFYPTGGGQPGDSGEIHWQGGRARVIEARKADEGKVQLVLAEGDALPPPGTGLTMRLDWERRHRLMRMHTALHLLSVVMPYPVSGGAVGEEKGRLDFDLPEPPEDREAIEAALNALVARDLELSESWITDAELLANPGLVKTMSVSPPMGQGRVRLVQIGQGADQVDLQPCGGTHVRRTGEIGPLVLGKFEKKGKQNRRVSISFA